MLCNKLTRRRADRIRLSNNKSGGEADFALRLPNGLRYLRRSGEWTHCPRRKSSMPGISQFSRTNPRLQVHAVLAAWFGALFLRSASTEECSKPSGHKIQCRNHEDQGQRYVNIYEGDQNGQTINGKRRITTTLSLGLCIFAFLK
jgi:hypothetical protein